MPMNLRRTLAVVVFALLATLGLTSCGSSDEARAAMDNGATVIDVRTPAEYESGNVEGALNIDVSAPDFVERVSELPKDDTYVVYCRSGNRSGQAAQMMRAMGFERAYNVGGFDQLARAGAETER